MPAITTAAGIAVGIDLFPVAAPHQPDLVAVLREEALPPWRALPGFVSGTVLRSRDGERAFVYSQWRRPHRTQDRPLPLALAEFYPPDRATLRVFASLPDEPVPIDDSVVHLAEFRMQPEHQAKMIRLATEHLPLSGVGENGLLSASFHASDDGTRVYNFGRWADEAGIQAVLRKPGFGTGTPYWAGIARNEFRLYEVVGQGETQGTP